MCYIILNIFVQKYASYRGYIIYSVTLIYMFLHIIYIYACIDKYMHVCINILMSFAKRMKWIQCCHTKPNKLSFAEVYT